MECRRRILLAQIIVHYSFYGPLGSTLKKVSHSVVLGNMPYSYLLCLIVALTNINEFNVFVKSINQQLKFVSSNYTIPVKTVI